MNQRVCYLQYARSTVTIIMVRCAREGSLSARRSEENFVLRDYSSQSMLDVGLVWSQHQQSCADLLCNAVTYSILVVELFSPLHIVFVPTHFVPKKQARRYAFVLEVYTNGMPWRRFKEFCDRDRAAGERFRARRLKNVCRDNPHLFNWKVNKGCKEILRAVGRANFGARISENHISKVAMAFYNDFLRDNAHLRRVCEDRTRFDLELSLWKDYERQNGKCHVGSSPSSVLRALKNKSIVENVADGNVIVWKADSTSRSAPNVLSRLYVV